MFFSACARICANSLFAVGFKRKSPICHFGLRGIVRASVFCLVVVCSALSLIHHKIQAISLLLPSSLHRENACIIILCRNSELDQLTISLANFEERFNAKHHYPYVLLNDVPFTTEFKATVTEVVHPSSVQFGSIPANEWSIPDWINTTRMEEGMAAMKENGIIYGDSLSYRHMCRYNSGFFFRHPLVMKYDYYWRIEPGVRFLCNVNFDPFTFMKQRSIKYSFVLSLPEIHATVPTLWNTTLAFRQSHTLPHGHLHLFRDIKMNWNGCHYWSNFEIASLNFFKSPAYIAYFEYLDKAGGFYYERWGDAPVHTLGTALILDPSEVHFFDEIGYEHPPFAHLPVTSNAAREGECMERDEVEKDGSSVSVLDFYGTNKCLKRWIWRWRGIKVQGTTLPEEASAVLQSTLP